MATELDVLILPAYDDLPGLPSEVAPWHEVYPLDETRSISGIDRPLRCTADGIGVLPTGVGKIAATRTVTALTGDPTIDLDETVVISAGIAGGPPARVTVGSIVVASSIVDWDNKLRFDRPPVGADSAIAPNPYNRAGAVVDLNEELIDLAVSAMDRIDLAKAIGPAATATGSEVEPPSIHVGTNLCGDELFHGVAIAGEAEWHVSSVDRAPYLATEMEDMGTARSLAGVGAIERYRSIRAISNPDRPIDGGSSIDERELADGATVALAGLVPAVAAVIDILHGRDTD